MLKRTPAWRAVQVSRRKLAALLAGAAGVLTYALTRGAASAAGMAIFLWIGLELSFVLFAFEDSAEYQMVRNCDLEGMANQRGRVIQVSGRIGQVCVNGEVWQAVVDPLSAPLSPGDQVVVREVNGLVLTVGRETATS